MKASASHGSLSLRDRVLDFIVRQRETTSLELRASFGRAGTKEASRLAKAGMVKRTGRGAYAA